MKLSTAVTLLGAAASALPGASAAHMALRGILPEAEKYDFLANVNCGSVAQQGCSSYGYSTCVSMESNGCGCQPVPGVSTQCTTNGNSGDICCEDAPCNTIDNYNKNSYSNAIDVCNSRPDCRWNGNDSSGQCVNSGGPPPNRSCQNLNENKCRSTNGCVYMQPSNGEQWFCQNALSASNNCQNQNNQNQCVRRGCEWYGNNLGCDIPCSPGYVSPPYNSNQCQRSACMWYSGQCQEPTWFNDFETDFESNN